MRRKRTENPLFHFRKYGNVTSQIRKWTEQRKWNGSERDFFHPFSTLAISRDENGRKRAEKLLSHFRFYIFSGNGIGFRKKNGIKNGWGYTEIRKQANTDGEPKK